MTFKEYYMKKHNMHRWGHGGELMIDVWSRQMDTIAEYVDLMLSEKIQKNNCNCMYNILVGETS